MDKEHNHILLMFQIVIWIQESLYHRFVEVNIFLLVFWWTCFCTSECLWVWCADLDVYWGNSVTQEPSRHLCSQTVWSWLLCFFPPSQSQMQVQSRGLTSLWITSDQTVTGEHSLHPAETLDLFNSGGSYSRLPLGSSKECETVDQHTHTRRKRRREHTQSRYKYYYLNRCWCVRWPWTWLRLFIQVCSLTMVVTDFHICDGVSWQDFSSATGVPLIHLPNFIYIFFVQFPWSHFDTHTLCLHCPGASWHWFFRSSPLLFALPPLQTESGPSHGSQSRVELQLIAQLCGCEED